jgi:hypothetical protein
MLDRPHTILRNLQMPEQRQFITRQCRRRVLGKSFIAPQIRRRCFCA